MTQLDRRDLLAFLGGMLSARSLASCRAAPAAPVEPGSRAPWEQAGPSRASPFIGRDGVPLFEPVALPLPHAGDRGRASDDAQRFASYEVQDTLVVPRGFAWDVLAEEGQRFGPAAEPASGLTFGSGADFTGLVPCAARPGEFWLLVNHEFIAARPWLAVAAADRRGLPRVRMVGSALEVEGRLLTRESVDLAAPPADLDPQLAADLRRLALAALGDLGLSILHVRQELHGGFAVLADSTRHKQLRGSDARLPTFGNCSGAVTPWNTFLSCEENFQDHVEALVDCRGGLLPGRRVPLQAVGQIAGASAPSPHPYVFLGLGCATTPALDGRDFGWVVHVDPENGAAEKLRALGRFQHENVALACRAGEPLVAYQGDDRTGGHVWRFVSAERVRDPRAASNLELLRHGRLEAARFEPDGSGRWLPLVPEARLARPRPEHTAQGFLRLPARAAAAADDDDRGDGGVVVVRAPLSSAEGISPEAWCAAVEAFCGRPFDTLALGDLVLPPRGVERSADALRAHRQDVLRLDAFAMAGALGATPCARPEDLELSPRDGSLFIAFTDAGTSHEGSPDARIFPDCRGESSRQYGLIMRLEQDSAAASRFTWSVFARSGELAAGGGGFAAPDNLAFDADGHLWFVCDISGADQNAAVDRRLIAPGSARFRGVFGPSAVFVIPTHGALAGNAQAFALGPAECELTGLSFAPDGRSLLVSVQHPGEVHGVRGGGALGPSAEREIWLAARDGTCFVQRRRVPLGSNFPRAALGTPPRSCVVCIRRA